MKESREDYNLMDEHYDIDVKEMKKMIKTSRELKDSIKSQRINMRKKRESVRH